MKTYRLLGATVPAAPARGEFVSVATPPPPARGPRMNFTPLSKTQKMVIARLAHSAWQEELKRGRVTISANLVKSKQFDDWRHDEQQKACGKRSLTDCTQFHYRELKAYFEGIIGTPAAAARSFRDNMRHGPVNDSAGPDDTHEGRELWGHKLQEAIKEFADVGIKISYAWAICKNKYKCKLTEATAYDLKRLTYDIISNGRSKRKKARASKNPF